MKNYATEALGTFFFVLVIWLVVTQASEFAPLAIWSVLMVMVYAGGHISWAHYNPAVTVWLAVADKISWNKAVGYISAQLTGAFLAAMVSYLLVGQTLIIEPSASSWTAILAELIFTFALVYVVLNTAATKATEGNSYYGLAIWFTVMVAAFAVGGISGGAFNPAIAFGPQLFDAIQGGSSISSIWIYIIGCFGGGFLAALRYNIINER